MSSRQCQSPGHLELAREWNFKDDLRLPVAHILRDPDQTEFLFYEFIYPKQYDYPCDDLINTFFQKPENCALRMFAQQRVLVSKQYTDYLNANNLFDEEPQEWRDLRDLIGASQKLLEKTSDADANFQELLAGINGVLY
ncbi:hypothetical protein H9Q74_014405 [Fusarium xylarioides]|nr:hypothetical protein H9Q71_013337 [Fusarium xylarioides]KAG5808465.1 hypothetical protein H9Q74_014405 [Fusarium xylarioides]